jgi:hypothetical protein
MPHVLCPRQQGLGKSCGAIVLPLKNCCSHDAEYSLLRSLLWTPESLSNEEGIVVVTLGVSETPGVAMTSHDCFCFKGVMSMTLKCIALSR